jgi:hypothetical protein
MNSDISDSCYIKFEWNYVKSVPQIFNVTLHYLKLPFFTRDFF